MTYIPLRGAVAKPLLMSLGRPLTRADLDRLAYAPRTTIPVLKKARQIHHKQAQLLAAGLSNEEVAAQVGTTSSRLSVLRNDPTFQELIAFYANQYAEITRETYTRVQETMVDILEQTTNEMQERLDNDETRRKMPLGELRKMAEFAADRTIAPTRATQQGSTTPPAKIELNFGFKPKAEQAKIVSDGNSQSDANSQSDDYLQSDGYLQSEAEFEILDRTTLEE